MRKLPFIALAAALSAGPAFAHEFWIEPANFRAADGASQMVEFYLGDGPKREEWEIRKERVQSLRDYSLAGVTDLQAGIIEGETEGMARVRLAGAGGHVVAFESNPSFIQLPSGEFNDYIQHEGIAPIIAERTANKTQDKMGRETYSRRAKALVRVGAGPDDIFTRPIGMTLEIVPQKSPYTLAAGAPLPVTVMFQGKPLAGAQVELARLDRLTDPVSVAKTGADGGASFAFVREGRWRLNVIWSYPLKNRTNADYDTTFSSLTFGFDN